MMMFGGPTHRLQAQIQAAGKVLDTPLSCMYLPDVMLISFEDQSTATSNIKFILQGTSLDIGKLQEAHKLYWKVWRASSRLCGCQGSYHLRHRSYMTSTRSRTLQSSSMNSCAGLPCTKIGKLS